MGTDNAVVNNGPDDPTYVNIGGLQLQPGQVYGIYVAGETGDDSVCYTDGGPTVYANADLSITTNTGEEVPHFVDGDSNFPRQWNGTVYYTVP